MTRIDDSTNFSTDVDQTIQWARQSLQRKRNELLEKKRELVKSHSVRFGNSGTSLDDSRANEMLQRGRKLLAEAEARSKILGQCAAGSMMHPPSPSSGHCLPKSCQPANNCESGSERGQNQDANSMNRFVQETGGSLTRNEMHEDSPTETPSWDNIHHEDAFQTDENKTITLDSVDDHGGDLEALLREGEARARLDELIATVRRKGDDPLKILALNGSPLPKQISSFDPTAMKAAKRAAIKEAKRAEIAAAAEQEARTLSSFKALPLPGGTEVKSNLHATTLSFKGKQAGTVDRMIRQDSKLDARNDFCSSLSGAFGGFGGVSVVTSQVSNENSIVYEDDEMDKERAKLAHAEKLRKKRQLLKDVNRFISMDVGEQTEVVDSSSFCSNDDTIEDVSSLQQQIAILEAKIKRKRSQRAATLNDIVEIDLNSLFETLIHGEVGGNAREIVHRLKDKFCDSVETHNNSLHEMPEMAMSISDELQQQRKRSLYRRHEEWVKERERKRSDARSQLVQEEMSLITGKPDLECAKQSWKRAKEAHDETLKRVIEEEKKIQREKEEKENISDELKLKELARLQKQAKTKLQSLNNEANKEEQMKRLEELSRPRQPVTRPAYFNKREDDDLDNNIGQISPLHHSTKTQSRTKILDPYKSAVKPNIVDPALNLEKKIAVHPDKRFSDMDDKEFQKIIKQITRKTKKLKASHATHDKALAKIELNGDPENLPELNGDKMDNPWPDQGEDYWKTGPHCSSSAQSNLMRKFNNTKSQESTDLRPNKKPPSTRTASSEVATINISRDEKEEPYEKYERGEKLFEDPNISLDYLRLRVRDARGFLPETICKLPYQARARDKVGAVTLLVGRKIGEEDELVITINFDKAHFDESSASDWWGLYKSRFIPV